MKNSRFIFLRLSLYLIAGMLCAFYIPLSQNLILAICVTALLFFIFAYYRAGKQLFPDSVLGIASFFLIFAIGLFTAYFSKPGNQQDHYLQISNTPVHLLAQGTVTEELKPGAFARRYILKMEKIISQNEILEIKGKVLLNIRTDSSAIPHLRPGNSILLPWDPKEINTALNPFQFDYRKYMKSLKVERQLQTEIQRIQVITRENNDLLLLAGNFREELIQELKKYDFPKDELAIFQALILGQRRDINDELYKKYAAAGAIHILAISGLHIGILLLFLNFILKPLEKFKTGKYIKPVTLIILLWIFAFLTGLSPSVVRAVCMFSFIAIGMQLKRKTSTLNSLFISLFFLLLINPYYLFQVGFQLSYLAVFGIITLQPLIYGVFSMPNKMLDYFWKLTSVSIAAQLAVLPLSLFYFHQFPGLFLITNIVVLPFLGFILLFGLIIIILAYLSILPGVLMKLFTFLLYVLNLFIGKIAGIDSMVFSEIDFSSLQMLSAYLIISVLIIFAVNPDYKKLILLLMSIIILQVSSFYKKASIPTHENVIFHKTRETLIGIKVKDSLNLLNSQYSQPELLQDYIRERQIKNIQLQAIPRIASFSGKLTLIVDSTANYNLPDFHPEYLILRNSPRVNLDRLIDQLKPRSIIADGSNYPSLVELWKSSCRNKKIPFHYTGKKGAYIIPEI